MDRLAVGEAISAGFRLVSREPLVFAGWIAVDFLISVLLSALLQATGAGANPAAAAGLTPVLLVLGFLLGAVLSGAVLRASLTPDDRRGLYLRLGAQEGRLALGFLALGAVMVIVSVPVITLVGGLLSAMVGTGPAGLAQAIGGAYAAAGLVCVWVFARLGLALPMAFRARGMRLVEAWRRSRPHAGRIFVVLAVLTTLTAAGYGVVIGAFVSMIGEKVPLAQLSATLQRDPQVLARVLDPTAVSAAGMMLLIIAAIARAAFFGAWADIDRQISGPETDPVFD